MAQLGEISRDNFPHIIPSRIGGMFGRFSRRIDGKGRFSIPTLFRKRLSNSIALYFFRRDHCIEGFDTRYLTKLVKGNHDRHDGIAYFMDDEDVDESAYDVTLDSRGRISIPAEIRSKIDVTDKIGIIGLGKLFRIYAGDSIP